MLARVCHDPDQGFMSKRADDTLLLRHDLRKLLNTIAS